MSGNMQVVVMYKGTGYVHCSTYCLNFVLADVVKSEPEVTCFFSLLENLYVFTSGSHIHQKWLEV